MKEILAENLSMFFSNSGIEGNCTYSGKLYEVWEVSDDDFKIMSNMSEEEFQKLCPNGMWRSANGSNLGFPDDKYLINGEEIIAWDGYRRCEYYNDYCKDCSDRISEMCKASDEDIETCCGERKYNTLLNYLCYEIGASLPKNVCALAVDLARRNNITMGELFCKYEG